MTRITVTALPRNAGSESAISISTSDALAIQSRHSHLISRTTGSKRRDLQYASGTGRGEHSEPKPDREPESFETEEAIGAKSENGLPNMQVCYET